MRAQNWAGRDSCGHRANKWAGRDPTASGAYAGQVPKEPRSKNWSWLFYRLHTQTHRVKALNG